MRMNILNTYPQIHPNSMIRNTEQEIIILLPERGKVTVLNDTGRQIVEWINGLRSAQEISDLLKNFYSISSEQASQDLCLFLEDLEKRGVIVLQEQPSRK